jgi:hypothetical protein
VPLSIRGAAARLKLRSQRCSGRGAIGRVLRRFAKRGCLSTPRPCRVHAVGLFGRLDLLCVFVCLRAPRASARVVCNRSHPRDTRSAPARIRPAGMAATISKMTRRPTRRSPCVSIPQRHFHEHAHTCARTHTAMHVPTPPGGKAQHAHTYSHMPWRLCMPDHCAHARRRLHTAASSLLALSGSGACLRTREGLQPLMSRVHRTAQEAKHIGARAAAPSPLAQPSPPQRHAPATRGPRGSASGAHGPIANKTALRFVLLRMGRSVPQSQHTTAAETGAFALSVGALGGGGRLCCREKDSASPSQSLLQGRALREWRDDGRATSVRRPLCRLHAR